MWIIKAFIKLCSIDSRNKQSPTCEVVYETKESWLQKSPTDFSLAQLAEHNTDDQEVVKLPFSFALITIIDHHQFELYWTNLINLLNDLTHY